ncbi:MAG: DUF2059 domain-containing protein [Pseudomonadota bacterium]
MKFRQAIAVALLCTSANGFAIDDTPENRAAQAERLMAATPPEEIMEDMIENFTVNLKPADRDDFRRLMTEFFNLDLLKRTMRESMIRNFTADEMAAISALYETPVGKSAMENMAPYMAEVMPVIQSEVMRAVGEFQRVKENEQQGSED